MGETDFNLLEGGVMVPDHVASMPTATLKELGESLPVY